MARTSIAGVDWSRTKAFVLPSDHNGQIRINLRGRERDGIVDPGEVDELRDRIAAGLLSFHDVGGGPAIAGVDRMEDVVGPDAPARGLLPDLLVRWADTPATRLEGVESPQYGRIDRSGQGSGRAGGHTADAWALLVPGRSRMVSRSGAEDVIDVAATACALLGGDMTGLAGTPLLEPS
jgi:predicted AlkP superfamily phosphohydrolase/phosphomutase